MLALACPLSYSCLSWVRTSGSYWVVKDEYFGIDRRKCAHPELGDDDWRLFYEHFSVFPWSELPERPLGFELGCGTGLWCHLLSQRSEKIIGLDHREEELEAARSNRGQLTIEFQHSDFFELSHLEEDSMDFGVALESLHLSTDLPKTLAACVSKLKPDAPLLIYLLYLPETPWGRMKVRARDLDHRVRRKNPTDHRYSKTAVIELMQAAGLNRIHFSPVGSFWTAVGQRKPSERTSDA